MSCLYLGIYTHTTAQTSSLCSKYYTALANGDDHLSKSKYDLALRAYLDAQIAARECGIDGNAPILKIRTTFDSIKKAKEKSDALYIIAKKQADSIKQVNATLETMRLTNNAFVAIYRDQNLSKAIAFEDSAIKKNPAHYQLRKAIYASVYEDNDKPHLLAPKYAKKIPKEQNEISGLNSFIDRSIKILSINNDTPPERAGHLSALSKKMATGTKVANDIIEAEGQKVAYYALSPGKKWLLTAFEDSSIKLYDLTNQSVVKFLSNGALARSACFSPDDRQLLIFFSDESVRLVGMNTGKTLNRFNDKVHAAIFSSDGKLVLTAYRNIIKLWNCGNTWQERAVLSGDNYDVDSAGFSPDNKYVWAKSGGRSLGGRNAFFRVWDISSPNDNSTLRGIWEKAMQSAFSPDGNFLFTVTNDTGRLFTTTGGNLKQVISFGKLDAGTNAMFSPSSGILVLKNKNGLLNIFDTRNSTLLGKPINILNGYDSIICAPGDNALCVVYRDRLLLVNTVTNPNFRYIKAGILSQVFFSGDGKNLFTLSEDGQLRKWGVSNAIELTAFGNSKCQQGSYIIAPDGNSCYCKIGENVAALIKTDKTGGEIITTLDGFFSAFYSPSGRLLVTVQAHDVKIWDIRKAKIIQSNHTKLGTYNHAVFSPDEQFICLSRDSINESAPDRFFLIDTNMNMCNIGSRFDEIQAFSNNSKMMLASSGLYSKVLKITGSNTPALNDALLIDEKNTDGMFSPDSKFLLVRSFSSFTLWDLTNMEKIATIPLGRPTRYFFSDDSKKIYTEYNDGTAKIWLLDPVELMDNLKRELSISLQADDAN